MRPTLANSTRTSGSIRSRNLGSNTVTATLLNDTTPAAKPVVSSTTPPADANDHEPPTMPPGFWGGIIDGATEAMVFSGETPWTT